MHDVDAVNAHFMFMRARMVKHLCLDRYPLTKAYTEDAQSVREEWAAELSKACLEKVTPSMAKNLFIILQLLIPLVSTRPFE